MQSSEVLARLKPFGISFEKSLSDLIKGIRAHSKDSPESLLTFLDNAIQECKTELATTDLEVKATAVLKLAYLEMYGFDMSWCNFQILEVMLSLKFQQKRIGYLAATQLFKNEQDLLILATNQFKKDLNSHNHIEIGLALSGIATIVTPNLAKDIVDDVVMKLSHLKPYIRKKAVLALFKIFLQYPESLRSSLPRVIEKLDDSDILVVSATITVVCEISKKNPNIFLGYLPKIFSILEDTTNNWLIIRILKLFQSLLKIEPRMKKKILPLILNLMAKTDATSLIYECINCIINGGMLSVESSKDKEIAKLCIDQIMKFFDTRDSNLKFVGLIALINILKVFPDFMHKIKGVSTVIMDCLTDRDLIIKRKALQICQFLVTEDNIANLVKTLLLQLVPEENDYRIPEDVKMEITDKILEIASQNNYANIPNFKWYVTALKELVSLTLLHLSENGTSIALSALASETIASKLGREFKSLATRVPSIRPFIMTKVILQYVDDPNSLKLCPSLMADLYFILGEYIDEVGGDDDESGDEILALGSKVRMYNTFVNNYVDVELNTTQFPVSKLLIELPNASVLTIFIQTLIKLFSGIVRDYQELYLNYGKLPAEKYNELAFFLWKAVKFLENWENHSDYEVQERALSWLEFMKLCLDAMTKEDLTSLEKLKADELAYYRKLSKVEAVLDDDEGLSDEDMLDLESESEDESEESESEEELENDHEEVTQEEQPNYETSNTPQEDLELPHLLVGILPSFFKSYPLNPVSATAQKRIPLPEDLDLETQINALPDFCFAASEPESSDEDVESADEAPVSSPEPKDDAKLKQRMDRLKDDPYYITSKAKKKSKHRQKIFGVDDSNSADTLIDKVSLDSVVPEKKEKVKKLRKMKKEKVVVLAEENFGNGEEEEVTQEKKKKQLIFASGAELANFDMESPAPQEDDDKKDYEYDIDLDAFRAQLAEKEAKKEKKKKKKKSKDSKEPKKPKDSKDLVEDKDSKLPVENQDPSQINESVQNGEFGQVGEIAHGGDLPNEELSSGKAATPDVEINGFDQVVTVPKKTTKKKKKRATIIE